MSNLPPSKDNKASNVLAEIQAQPDRPIISVIEEFGKANFNFAPAEKVNKTCDDAINRKIIDMVGNSFLAKCYDPRFKGMDATQVFRILMNEKNDGEKQSD